MTIERQLLIGGEQLAAASGKRTEDRDPYTGDAGGHRFRRGSGRRHARRRCRGGRLRGLGGHCRQPKSASCSWPPLTSSNRGPKRRPN